VAPEGPVRVYRRRRARLTDELERGSRVEFAGTEQPGIAPKPVRHAMRLDPAQVVRDQHVRDRPRAVLIRAGVPEDYLGRGPHPLGCDVHALARGDLEPLEHARLLYSGRLGRTTLGHRRALAHPRRADDACRPSASQPIEVARASSSMRADTEARGARSKTVKIAVIDDYQDVFKTLGNFHRLAGHEVVTFSQPERDQRRIVERLKDFDAVILTQQRTWFPRALIEQLPNLKLIAQTSGTAHIDLEACTERGIVVSAGGRAGRPNDTAELTS